MASAPGFEGRIELCRHVSWSSAGLGCKRFPRTERRRGVCSEQGPGKTALCGAAAPSQPSLDSSPPSRAGLRVLIGKFRWRRSRKVTLGQNILAALGGCSLSPPCFRMEGLRLKRELSWSGSRTVGCWGQDRKQVANSRPLSFPSEERFLSLLN